MRCSSFDVKATASPRRYLTRCAGPSSAPAGHGVTCSGTAAPLVPRRGSLQRQASRAASGATSCTSNDTKLEKLKERLQFALYCIDCFVS